jgi:hypothetical protein
MYLQRLVYYAENKIRDLEPSMVKEIKAIRAAGHRNNPSAGLTGTLAFNERWFVGVLEGDRKLVSSMLVKIAGDRRADGLVILSTGAVDERLFDDWTLVYAGHSDVVDRLYLHHGLVSGLDPSRSTAAAMLAVARGLSKLDAHAHVQAREGAHRDPVHRFEAQEVIHVQPVLPG